MAIDGFFLQKLIIEVKEKLLNNRLQKVEMIKKDIFSFNFYYQKQINNLIFKLNSPVASFLISNNFDVDKELKSNFLSNLEKHLNGFILTNIEQHKNDRVVIFTFSGNDFLEGRITKSLVLEIMGRYNNLILIQDGIVIDAFNKNVSSESRSIVPKVKYEFYPTNKKELVSFDFNNLENNQYLSRNYLGVSPLLSNYLFYNNIALLNTKVNPTLNLDNNKFYWFDLFDSDNKKHFNNLSLLLDYLINHNYKQNDNRYLTFVEKRLINYQKRLINSKKDLRKAHDNLSYKDYGNYIYSSGLNLNSNYSKFVSYDNKEIKVDSQLTLLENAQNYFKLYEKAKRTIIHLEEQIKELKNLIVLFEQLHYDVLNNNFDVEQMNEVLKPFGFKVKKRQPRKTSKKFDIKQIEYEDSIFYIGKNNLQNEYVTHQIGKNNDYWFHIKDKPGSHIVMKGTLNDETLLFGAMLAAYFSKDKDLPIITINYTKIKDIRKIPRLPGYNVILRNYQSINVKVDYKLIESYIGHNS